MIDPSIPLSYRPPEIKDPLQAAGQVLQMKNLMQQQQLGGLELQQKQLELDRTKSINDAYRSSLIPGADGTVDVDAGKLSQALATAGHGSAIPSILEGITKMQKSRADLTETLGKVAAAQQDFAGSIGSAVQAAKNDPNLFLVLADHAAKTKSVDAQLVNSFTGPVRQALEQDPTGETARPIVAQIAAHLVASSPGQQKLITEGKTADARMMTAKTGEQRLTAEMPGIKSNNLIKGLEATAQTVPNNQADWDTWRGSLDPGIAAKVSPMFSPAEADRVRSMAISPYQAKELEGQAAGRTETGRHNKVEEGQGAARVGIARQEQVLRQKNFDATYGALVGPDGKPLEPEAAKAVAMTDPLAVAIANYQKAPPPAGSRGPGASIMRKVLTINPDFDEKTWQQQRDLTKEFTTGGVSKQLDKMNTALGHLGVLDQAAEALNNSNLPLLNSLANKIGAATGSDKATVFKTIVHRLGPEIEGAYVGGAGTGGERGKTEADFDPSLGYKQIKSNIAVSANLFRSKIGTEEYRWKQAFKDKPMPFGLTPEAEHTMQRVTGSDSNGAKTAAAAGGAPALPATLGGGDLGKVYTNRQGQKIKITDVNPQNGKQFKFVVVQ
jgi:hypothetical protein